jgi:hypothetical protein
MKLKSDKTQIREKLFELDETIKYQYHRYEKSKKRFFFKRDSTFSFFIWDNVDTLKFIMENEKNILNDLENYRENVLNMLSC